MLRHALSRVQTAILLRPRRVIALSAALVAGALVLGAGVEFRTSRSELAPPDDPDQLRWSALLSDYRGSEALIACVEAEPGGDPGGLAAFTDRLAEAYRREPRVDQVFRGLDTDWFRERFLYLLDREDLDRLAAILERVAPLLPELAAATDLARLDETLARRIARGAPGGATIPDGEAGALTGLRDLLELEREFLENPRAVAERLRKTTFPPVGEGQGYLTTRDGTVYFLLATPRGEDDSLRARRELVRALRSRTERVRAEAPGFRVAFAGPPALVVEEMNTVRRDTWVTSLVAVVGVTLLTFFVFRWRSHAILVLVALGVGIAWAFGAVRLELGYLNLITSSFISTLVGVGVAYGIHPVSEYELEGAHTRDPVPTLRESFHRTGPAVTVAAVTTAAAFFSIPLMRFRGFGELGLVAGVGALLCLASAMITLPAVLVVYGRWRRARDRDPSHRPAPAVDRIWVEQVAGRICRHPRGVALAALALTALAAWGALGLRFDSDILDLLPRNAESLRYQRKMALESDLSPLYNIVVADDLRSLERMREIAASEPSIERFESVLRFLPHEPARARRVAARLDALLGDLQLPERPTPIAQERLVAALDDLERALADAAEAAFGAGLGDLAASLETARAAAEACRRSAAAAPAPLVAAWNDEQPHLWEAARSALGALRRAAQAPPPTLSTLPAEVLERFATRSGRLLGFLFPAASVFDPDAREAYVAASRRVSAEVTGFPLVFHEMTRRFTRGFRRAVAAGALVVAAILLIDYRNLRDTLLALLPLTLGIVWMMGGMRLLGLSFNFANLVAVPLILGVGIDNGVHVIHRVRLEGREGMGVVLRHTGRAILIASLTTMIGFGSLSLASHRGLSGLGLVLFLGVGSCLLTSTVVLPNLLVLFGLVRR